MNKHLMLAAVLMSAASVAVAGGHYYGPYPALYMQECASCHIAYPPQVMTAPGWTRVMNQLDRHFGTDASLDAKTRDAIAAYLAERASPRDKHAPTESTGRITQTAWFVREHRKAPPATTSFADCVACHTRADQADYSERNLKLRAGFRQQERE